VEVLRQQKLLLVAPEGTRTGDGRLRRGKTGIVTLAVQTGVPVMPLVHYGGESFWSNLKRGRRTDFTFRAGPVFRVATERRSFTPSKRQEAADEIMAVIASLLPPAYHGYYRDRIPEHYSHLRFEDGPGAPVRQGE
jgi:1-acyl-sn-glycerol-3-phosphate acyltransferase